MQAAFNCFGSHVLEKVLLSLQAYQKEQPAALENTLSIFAAVQEISCLRFLRCSPSPPPCPQAFERHWPQVILDQFGTHVMRAVLKALGGLEIAVRGKDKKEEKPKVRVLHSPIPRIISQPNSNVPIRRYTRRPRSAPSSCTAS